MGRRRPRGRLERAGRAVRRAVAAARYGTPARDLAPPRPGPPGHAASSLVGLPAGASQGQRGRRRSGLSAPTAPRCAPSALPRALRAARRPLVRLLVRPPGPPLRLPPPPPPALSLARSLALCGARRAPSSPARPSRPRPFPPPAPERLPRACPGAFSPVRPDSAFPPSLLRIAVSRTPRSQPEGPGWCGLGVEPFLVPTVPPAPSNPPPASAER